MKKNKVKKQKVNKKNTGTSLQRRKKKANKILKPRYKSKKKNKISERKKNKIKKVNKSILGTFGTCLLSK